MVLAFMEFTIIGMSIFKKATTCYICYNTHQYRGSGGTREGIDDSTLQEQGEEIGGKGFTERPCYS